MQGRPCKVIMMAEQHHPDEDLKAVEFVRISLLRKNKIICQLKTQLRELQDEVLAWRQKFNGEDHSYRGSSTEGNETFINEEDAGNDFEDFQLDDAMEDGKVVKDEGTTNDVEVAYGTEDYECEAGEKRTHEDASNDISFTHPMLSGLGNSEAIEYNEQQQSVSSNFVDNTALADEQNAYDANYNSAALPENDQISTQPLPTATTSERLRMPQGRPSRRSTEAAATMQYRCSVCERAFATQFQLVGHMRVHTGERPWACPVPGCGYRASHSGNLSAHMLTHTGARPHACPVEGCAYRSREKFNLARHMFTHTGEKPYACPVQGCGYRAAERPKLTVHMRHHTGERPYVCEAQGCGFRTVRRQCLNVHMRKHTGEKPYACPVQGCGYRTAQNSSLTKHVRTHAG